MKKTCLVCLLTLFAVCGTGPHLRAESFPLDVVAKAQPDEFYTPDGPYIPFGAQSPGAVGVAKVNHNGLWGLTATKDRLWFGDIGGKRCLGAASQPGNPVFDKDSDPKYCICEFEESRYPGVPARLPPALRRYIGDWRPPDVYCYDPATSLLEKKTPDDPRISLTLGLRAAGANHQVVFLGGPHLYTLGINLFAYDARTGRYLGSANFPQYNNIRRWVQARGGLYTAVSNASGGGSVLRWTGSLRDPFQFEVVGSLDADGAYLCEHEGRLFVTTWPQDNAGKPIGESVLGGLWMSPLLGRDGLQASDTGDWRKVWSIGAYEPDPTIAKICGGGAVVSYGGYLYWGTMEGPGQGLEALVAKYGEEVNTLEALANSSPAIAIFRGSRFGTKRLPKIELLYGETSLPVYIPGGVRKPGKWEMRPNRYASATWGPAGFGNPFNSYTWSMEVHKGQLFIGTYDWNILLFADEVARGEPVPDGLGGDLYCIPDTSSPAEAVTLDGGGNVFNNGFRNLQSLGDALYVGTGNVSNLQDVPGSAGRGGGWELLRMQTVGESAKHSTKISTRSRSRLPPRWRTR